MLYIPFLVKKFFLHCYPTEHLHRPSCFHSESQLTLLRKLGADIIVKDPVLGLQKAVKTGVGPQSSPLPRDEKQLGLLRHGSHC